MDRFRLRYAESTDGLSWSEGGWVLYGTSDGWDKGGINRGVSVLLINGTYHLWYAGTNDGNLQFSPYWRIGYATSSDGINWTKQNNGNPVLEPSEAWELANVSFPMVIFEAGLFKMWYATASGDAPLQIAYAYSSDGINWVKPAVDNPVLTRSSSSWDSYALTISSAAHENDVYKIWYSGYNGSNWAIGLASSTTVPTGPSHTHTNPYANSTFKSRACARLRRVVECGFTV